MPMMKSDLAKALAKIAELEAENKRLRGVLEEGWRDSFGNWVIPSELIDALLKEGE